MLLSVYLRLLQRTETAIAQSFRTVAEGHGDEPDVFHLCHTLATQCDTHTAALAPATDRYGEGDGAPERLDVDAIGSTRDGPLGLLRDLQELYVLVSMGDITWMMVKQAALGLRDDELQQIVTHCESETAVQLAWLRTRMKQAAPQALLVAS